MKIETFITFRSYQVSLYRVRLEPATRPQRCKCYIVPYLSKIWKNQGRQSTSPSPRDPVKNSPVAVILEDPVRRVSLKWLGPRLSQGREELE